MFSNQEISRLIGRSIATKLFATGKLGLDFLAPPICPITNERLAEPRCVSGAGWAQLHFLTDPLCSICGIPFEIAPTQSRGLICAACAKEKPSFDSARSAVAYNDVSRKLILQFKTGDRTEYADMFAAWLSQINPLPFIPNKGLVIAPIPLHWRRLWSRRYNQSALIGKSVSKTEAFAGAQFIPDLLIRKRSTPPQKDLSVEARWRNVAGAFEVNEKRMSFIKDAVVVLVDDVLTSGATISGCARVLKRSGCKEVHALTIARVVKSGAIAL